MKAPEKIYLQPLENDEIYNHWYSSKLTKEFIEYTRTDAFIERACSFIKERLIFEDNAWYVNNEITIKDKVIKDFKNYMKGE